MVWRIVGNALRQYRWIWLAWIQFLLMAWYILPKEWPHHPILPVVFTLALCHLFAVTAVPARSLLPLPVSGRQVWLALWVSANLVPALLVLVVAAIVPSIPAPRADPVPPDGAWLLAGVWTLLLGTTSLGLVALFHRGLEGAGLTANRRDALGSGAFAIGLALTLTTAMLLQPYLPMTPAAAATPAGAGWLGGAALLGLVGFLHQPRPAARPWLAAPTVRQSALGSAGGGWRVVFDDRLKGLPKLLLREAKFYASILVMLLLVGGLLAALHVFWPDIGIGDDLFDQSPFFGGDRAPIGLLILCVLMLGGRDGDRGQFSSNLLRATMRHLRSLPVARWTLAMMLVARRGGGWVAAWVWLLVLHLGFIGPVETLRLDWLLLFAGADGLLDAFRFRWGLATAFVFAGTFGLMIALIVGTMMWASPVGLALVGFVCLGLSYATHLDNLSSGSNLYKEEAADAPLTVR